MAEGNVSETRGEEKAGSSRVEPLDQYETGGFRKNLDACFPYSASYVTKLARAIN